MYCTTYAITQLPTDAQDYVRTFLPNPYTEARDLRWTSMIENQIIFALKELIRIQEDIRDLYHTSGTATTARLDYAGTPAWHDNQMELLRLRADLQHHEMWLKNNPCESKFRRQHTAHPAAKACEYCYPNRFYEQRMRNRLCDDWLI